MTEPEVITARRAFGDAQAALAGERVTKLDAVITVGWHDTTVQPESGCFALVRQGGTLDALVGEVIKVSYGSRSVFAYVLGAAGVPTDLSLARRAFLALGLLALESLDCSVEIVA